jgi:hypoxanthine-DNA glycosylase
MAPIRLSGKMLADRRAGARVTAFPPILGPTPAVLVLGSLPGVASLRAGEYYAHPRNQFWDIMGELFGASRELDYTARTARLKNSRVAVWDVLREAARPGSLDSQIDRLTAEPNDIASLLARRGSIRVVAFNGGMAEKLFVHFIRPALGARGATLAYFRLPSTSPANASSNYRSKLARWRCIARAAADPVIIRPAATTRRRGPSEHDHRPVS